MPKLTNHPTKRENICIALNQAISRRKLLQLGKQAVSLSIKNTRNGFFTLAIPLYYLFNGKQGVRRDLFALVLTASFLPLTLCLPPLAVGSDGVALNQLEKVIL